MSSRLTELLEKLSTGEYQVALEYGNLAALDPKEAVELAQALKASTLSLGNYQKKPEPLAGLAALAEKSAEARPILLECLASIPPGDLGPWACPLLNTYLGDATLRPRATQIQASWERDGSTKLKTAMKSFGGK